MNVSRTIPFLFLLCLIVAISENIVYGNDLRRNNKFDIIEVKNAPEDVVWVVQLSDLHFSVHHPERALDFKSIIGPTLSFINPSLVFITGDLTDGKSKDMLVMKQDEKEWIEYQKVMEDVVRRSGLNESIFYDVRGNHDNFGVSSLGGSSDFYMRYSFYGQLNRRELVNSVVIETGERELLFVGFDSTTSSGLRGPTNLFGHPTDQLLNQINSALSLRDSLSMKPITKIAFGHFPLSFSAASSSGKTLKDIFLKTSLSAYLCGHLHTKFGTNLKRHHKSSHQVWYSQESIQLDASGFPSDGSRNCSDVLAASEEFWEWEMGDWRKSRAMRILAIDRGQISFVDIDFQLGKKKTIILPTFPLDSRFLSTSYQKEKCQSSELSFEETIRALVFSASPIVSVVARIYDLNPGSPIVVMESSMRKHEGVHSRGDLYSVPWHLKAFDDPSPLRYWLQIEAIDILGRSSLSELRPFSLRGIHAKFSWTWKELFVMGCQWSALYFPILWLLYCLTLSLIIIPKVLLIISRKQCTFKHFCANKGVINCMAWIFTELYKVPMVWCFVLAYLFYLILCPWFHGQVFTDSKERGYMTIRGWVLKHDKMGETEFLGFPDVMVIVLPHLLLVVLPAIWVIGAFFVERSIFHDYFLSLSGKKEDDQVPVKSVSYDRSGNSMSKPVSRGRWMRKFLLVAAFIICWKHLMSSCIIQKSSHIQLELVVHSKTYDPKNLSMPHYAAVLCTHFLWLGIMVTHVSCGALIKAYEMNPILDFPVYSLAIPLLLAYTVYRTGMY